MTSQTGMPQEIDLQLSLTHLTFPLSASKSQIQVFLAEDNSIFTSLSPDAHPWTAPANMSDTITMNDLRRPQWHANAYPFLPFAPSHMDYTGLLFERLAYNARTLPIERTHDGRYHLQPQLRERWFCLEKMLTLVVDTLTNTTDRARTRDMSFPRRLGYCENHSSEDAARISIMGSRDAFILLVSMCSYAIARHSRDDQGIPQWERMLAGRLHAQYIDELRASMVGDFTIKRVGTFIKAEDCDATHVLALTKRNTPVWIYWRPDISVGMLCDPTVMEWSPNQWQIDQVKAHRDATRSLPPEPFHPTGPFPKLPPYSRQRPGETWRAYFQRIGAANERFESEKESPAQCQRRLQRLENAKSHSLPGKRGPSVFHWERVEGGYRVRTPITRAQVEDVFLNYGDKQRRFDSFANEWDLCTEFDSFETPDDIKESWDYDDPKDFIIIDMKLGYGPPTAPDPIDNEPAAINQSMATDSPSTQDAATSLASTNIPQIENVDTSLADLLPASPDPPSIENVDVSFTDPSPASANPPHIENVNASRADLEIALRVEASPDDSDDAFYVPCDFPDILYTRYGLVDNCVIPDLPSTSAFSTSFKHVRMSFGDHESTLSDGDMQRWQPCATALLCYAITKARLDHQPAPPRDLDDLPTMVDTFKISNVTISPFQKGRYIVGGKDLESRPDWMLVVDAAAALQCVRSMWGPTTERLAQQLLTFGIPFYTFLPAHPQSVPRRPKIQIPGLGWRAPGYQPDALEYVAYERKRDQFLRGPRGRAALMSGGIVWRLAVDSLGLSHDLILAGPSAEAQLFGAEQDGLMVKDDQLTTEEEDLICGVYRVASESPSHSGSSFILILMFQLDHVEIRQLIGHGGRGTLPGSSLVYTGSIGLGDQRHGSSYVSSRYVQGKLASGRPLNGNEAYISGLGPRNSCR